MLIIRTCLSCCVLASVGKETLVCVPSTGCILVRAYKPDNYYTPRLHSVAIRAQLPHELPFFRCSFGG